MPQYFDLSSCNWLRKVNTFPNIFHTHPCLQIVTSHWLQKSDTLPSMFPTHSCLNISNCRPVVGFRRLTLCPECSLSIHVSVCWPVDLSPVLKGWHVAQYVPYPFMSQYVKLSTCHQLKKVDNTLPSMFPTHPCLNMPTCWPVTCIRGSTHCQTCSLLVFIW